MTQFINFDLDEKILKVLEEIGYSEPTPIQKLVIPKVSEGCDVIVSAPTGTGKTAAFMLPIMNNLCKESYRSNGGPQVLILVPTRELAIQVAKEAERFSKYLPRTKTVCIYGGVPYPEQRKVLSRPYEVLVATPGRLIDHMEQGKIDLSKIKLLVLDEADRMLDMGFCDDVQHISSAMPKERQTMLFSATIDKKILPFSKKLLNDPFEIKVELDLTTQNNIEQQLFYVDGLNHKIQILEHILENTEINQSIIFTSTISQANELADYLQDKGYTSEALHGDMNQRQRSRTITKLRTGRIQLLIATDVAARGIDIPDLSHVINFDLPFQSEDFVHRIGRTGRAGAKGLAITFSTHKEELKLLRILKIIGKSIPHHTVAGLEPKAKAKGGDTQRRQRSSPSRFSNRSGGYSDRSEGNSSRSGGYSDRSEGNSQPSQYPKERTRSSSPSREFEGQSNRSEGYSQQPPRTREKAYSSRPPLESDRSPQRESRFSDKPRSSRPSRDEDSFSQQSPRSRERAYSPRPPKDFAPSDEKKSFKSPGYFQKKEENFASSEKNSQKPYAKKFSKPFESRPKSKNFGPKQRGPSAG